jgi:hypothetical protein
MERYSIDESQQSIPNSAAQLTFGDRLSGSSIRRPTLALGASEVGPTYVSSRDGE